ncbi:MAG: hypothetical protein LBL01_02720 [Bifidobacteriaceae bacterium]|jgi:hypothetical protein|nr:hypothetical protein [Bifidobacteriaceae bacterium]
MPREIFSSAPLQKTSPGDPEGGDSSHSSTLRFPSGLVGARPYPAVDAVQPIGETADRAPARVAGIIRSLVIGPRGPDAVFEADLEDQSGVMRILWLGQRQVLGIEPGRGLVCEGRVAVEGGQRVMRDPRYQIMPVGDAE